MPNIVNNILYRELENDLRNSGSCLFLSFDKLTVEQDGNLRTKLREAGVDYRVVKNRLASKGMSDVLDVDVSTALVGKCGVVFAPEEKAISAAKLVREAMKTHKANAPVRVVGGIIEGEAILGDHAANIADMPDRTTVNTQLVTALSGPARMVATVLNAVQSGLARCIQQKIEQGGGEA